MIDASILPKMAERIVERFQPLRIILFGSMARGDASAANDVDLLVVMPEGVDRRHSAIEIRRALKDFSVGKDILVTTPEEIARRGDLVGTILCSALREGKVLYERN